MSATLFHEHCRHVSCAFGSGRNGKNGLLLQKCPQAASACRQENMFLLVEKGTTLQQITKLYGKLRDWVAGEQGKLWERRGGRVTASVMDRET